MSMPERLWVARWQDTQPRVTLMRITTKPDIAPRELMSRAVNKCVTPSMKWAWSLSSFPTKDKLGLYALLTVPDRILCSCEEAVFG